MDDSRLKAFRAKIKAIGLECKTVPAFTYVNKRTGKLVEVDEHERCYKKKKGIKPKKEEEKAKPEAKPIEEKTDILSKAIKANNGYPMSMTPDGKESILYKELLDQSFGDTELADKAKAQVYSEDFKNWFGDWQKGESETNSVSKVIDANGEPLIVYHGGPDEIRTFDERYGGDTTANNDYGAFFFTDDYTVGEDYSRQGFIRRWQDRTGDDIAEWYDDHPFTAKQLTALNEDSGAIYDMAEDNLMVVAAYANIREPFTQDYEGRTIDTQETMKQVNFVKNGIDEDYNYYDDYTEIDPSWVEDFRTEIEDRAVESYDLPSKSQIKDFQFQDAQSQIFEENEIYPELKALDGLILKNVVDDIGDASRLVMDEYIIIKPKQIKSVFNCCQFSSPNANIYGTKIGKIIAGTLYEGMTVREILETPEGRDFLKKKNYFE